MRDRLNDKVAILWIALLIDLLNGDLPNRYHPVAWMGSLIGGAQKRAPAGRPGRQLAYGGLIALGGVGATAGIGLLIAGQLDRLPTLLKWLAGGLLLKQTFSLRGLSRAAGDIQGPLAEGDLPEARGQVSWHLVSRDTSELTESQIVAATVESLAENASDSVVAPLFYYLALGLPGALAYRFANTADAMLGYRDEAREWLGKIPARLDDVANLLPSRLTALLFIAAAFLAGENGRGAFSIWRRDGSQGQSPNAGQSMSAVAGALDLELEKVGRYKFGEGNREPAVPDIGRTVRLLYVAALLGLGLATVVLGFRKKGLPA